MSRQHLNRACKNGAPKPKKCESTDWSEPFESNFDEVVKNIDLEFQKSKYNPKIDMNWCYLPMEMRLECVKRMDFKTRCAFRGVSESEEALVKLEKYKFEHLQITFKNKVDDDRINRWDIIAKSENGRCELHIRTKGCLNGKFLSAIFKHAEVENFCFSASNTAKCDVRPILKQLENFAPFPFERVAVFHNRSMDFFMQTCPNLERIDVDHQLPYKKMLKIRSLIEIKEFKFFDKWIENDAEVGKLVQCLLGLSWNVPRNSLRLFDTFSEKFADRIIEKTDKIVRIRMNNGKTHILMRSLESEEDSFGAYFCSCKVIPIDLPKSEYGKGDEWIQVFYEQRLENAGKLEKAKEFDPEDQEIWDD